MVSESEKQRIIKKAINDITSLTPEELKIYKYKDVGAEEIVDSDDYSDAEVESIKERKENGEPISDVESAVLTGKKIDTKNELLTTIINGTNDVFVKQYHFAEDKVSFTITIREPNIREQGRILAEENRYLNGYGNYISGYWADVFYALALLRVCGERVPIELQDDREIHAPQYAWLIQILEDFNEWEARFQQ